MAFKNQVLDGNTTNNSDQRIMEDFPLQDIMKEYFCEEDFESFYSDVFDIEPFGDLSFPDIVPDDVAEMNADFLVPDPLFVDEFCQKYDDTEPEEQLFSLLEEYIQEEEDRKKGNKTLELTQDSGISEPSPANSVSCQTNQAHVLDPGAHAEAHTETAGQRRTKNPRKRHMKRTQELSHNQVTNRKKRRKNKL